MLVHKASSENLRKRSLTDSGCSKKSLQHDYSKAQEIGTECYTTAEIPANVVGEEYILNIGDDKIYGEYQNVPLQQGTTYKIYVAVKVTLPVSCYVKQTSYVEHKFKAVY